MNSCLRRPRFFRFRSSGFTVIEVLVAMVGMMIVGGIVIQIYIETERAAQKMVRRQAAIDFGVSFLDQTSDLIRGAVLPGDLDVQVNTQFAPDRFGIPAFADPASNGLFLVSIRPTDEESDGQHFEIVREVLAGSGDSSGDSQTVSAYGLALAAAKPEVAFRYATEVKPGERVPYRDRLEPGEWPVLVEISVSVPSEGEDPITMKTAVIPGRVIAEAPSVKPTPTPTPLPSGSLQTGEAQQSGSAESPPAASEAEESTTEAVEP